MVLAIIYPRPAARVVGDRTFVLAKAMLRALSVTP
jgi:hypothetical protein